MISPPTISGNRTDLGAKRPASNEPRLAARHQPRSRSQSRRRSMEKERAIQGIAHANDSATHPHRDIQNRHRGTLSSRPTFANPTHAIVVSKTGVAATIRKATSCTTIGSQCPSREHATSETMTRGPVIHSHLGHLRRAPAILVSTMKIVVLVPFQNNKQVGQGTERKPGARVDN